MEDTTSPSQRSGFKRSWMRWVWLGVFILAALMLGRFDSGWDALHHVIEEHGKLSDDDVSWLGFIAGYTLPLTVGFGVAVLIGLRGGFDKMSMPGVLLSIAAILFIAGAVAQAAGLGLLPSYALKAPSGPFYISALRWVLQGYFNTYGWPLMVAAAAIGSAAALHVHVVLEEKSSSPPA